MVLNGIDDGFSFECVEFDVTVVRHPNRVTGVVISSVGYLG